MNTPVCPGCGAKFSFSHGLQQCGKCGLPAEIVHLGPQAVARWKKDRAKATGISKRERKQKVRWGSRERKSHKKKHGRVP